jgi:CHASE2 domain-containing sensor protein
MDLAAGGGAACGDAGCGDAAWGAADGDGACPDGAWTTSFCGLGLLAGAGTDFDVPPEGTATVCVAAGLVFTAVGATAGAAVAAGWLPPMPNQLPIVCRVDVDSADCTARVDAGA